MNNDSSRNPVEARNFFFLLFILTFGWITFRALPPAEAQVTITEKPSLTKKLLSKGEVLYKEQCSICHGMDGKGDGPAATFLYPKPRDFTNGVYKLRSTSFLPTDADLFQTISKGIPGTLMPSFAYLPSEEQWALVAYVKAFSEKFESGESLEPVAIPNPPAQTQELLDSGKTLYTDYGCVKCHGATGKGDGPSAATLKDIWGNPIIPYDFTLPGKMKGGSTAEHIYRTLAVGMGGTPMPAYGEPESDEHTQTYWALAYYVLSLTQDVPPQPVSGDPIIGKDLFMGTRRFQNGGAACMPCHSISGIGALGGGALGPDLSPAHSKFHDDGLTSILTDLPFPTMSAVFSEASVTPEEQAHLINFFRVASVAQRSPVVVGQLALLAVGGAVVLLILTNLLWWRRLTGVRLPLVGR